MSALSARDLAAAVHGDFAALAAVWTAPHSAIVVARSGLADLVVSREDIWRVLTALQRRLVLPEQAAQWAFFVRHGHAGYWASVSPGTPPPDLRHVASIKVDYEPAYEEFIAHVIARLDEIGDRVDGAISGAELAEWLRKE